MSARRLALMCGRCYTEVRRTTWLAHFTASTLMKKFVLIAISAAAISIGYSALVNNPNPQPYGADSSLSSADLFPRLVGRYQGVYKQTAYEVWIEQLTSTKKFGEPFAAILVFEQHRVAEIKSQLIKQRDEYKQDVCRHLRQNPRQSPYPEVVGTYGVWNDMGGLGWIFMQPNQKSEAKLGIRTTFYIDLPHNDEHALQYLYTNANGQAIKIRFSETGYIQKPWSYFFPGPSMELEKTSSGSPDMLKQYYTNFDNLNEDFLTARQSDRSPCN